MTTTTIVPLAKYQPQAGDFIGASPASTVTVELDIPHQNGNGTADATLYTAPTQLPAGDPGWHWCAEAGGGAHGCDSIFTVTNLDAFIWVHYEILTAALQLQVNLTF